MKNNYMCALTIASLLFFIGCNPAPKTEDKPVEIPEVPPVGKFLNFSDLHFDPYFDTTLVDTLMKSPYTEWEAIYESSSVKKLSKYHHDSNYPLLKSALEKMKEELDKPDFIMISGDFLSHHYESDFTRYSKVSFNADKDENYQPLHSFNEKTMRFIASMITKKFPGIPVWSTLGNNDAFCGDYLIQPNASFLSMLSGIWKPMLNCDNTGTFDTTFPVGGYYALKSPLNERHKIIVLNSILFSINFNDPSYRQAYCALGDFGPNNEQPGEDQIEWLKQELNASREEGEKVWLIQHIPPGMNVFGTIPKDTSLCVGDTSSYFLKPKFNAEYLSIVADYADIISSNMAGHYHRDDFRLIKNEAGKTVSYMHILPAISPIYYNNPGFEVVTYDRESTELLDYTTFYTNVKSEDAAMSWELEYSFKKTYHQSKMTAQTMDVIHHSLMSDATMAANYMKYYPVSESASMKDFRFYWCGISNLTPESYQRCLCNQ